MSLRDRLSKAFTTTRVAKLIVAILVIGVSIFYGANVERKARSQNKLSGMDRQVHRLIHSFRIYPSLVLEMIAGDRQINTVPQEKIPDNANVVIGKDSIPVNFNYLYNYYNKESGDYIIRDLDLSNNQINQEWSLSFDELSEMHNTWRKKHLDKPTFNIKTSELNRHVLASPLPYLSNNLIAICQGMLIRIDGNSKVVWSHDKIFHHSLEFDYEGNIWACSASEDSSDYRPYRGDQIVKLDPETGEVLFKKTIDDIFRANPYHNYSRINRSSNDPYHLNDVQPVLTDSKYWDVGDVFISAKSFNCVFLYRPSTNKILWSTLMHWSQQHDVNILNDSVITIFDNNLYFDKRYKDSLNKNRMNMMVAYNFSTDSVQKIYPHISEQYNVNTKTEGRGRFFPQDSVLFMEATTQSFGLIYDAKRNAAYKFIIPGWEDGKAGHMKWFRLLPDQPAPS